MRPRLRSYGETSTRTLSPGSTRMRNRRIFPARWASSSWSFSSFTRNSRFGRASVTSPSISSFCSTAIGFLLDSTGSRRQPPAAGYFNCRSERRKSSGARPAGELIVARELLQRGRLELTHALRRKPDHLADGPERALPLPVEPEAQEHDGAVAALQALDRVAHRPPPRRGER